MTNILKIFKESFQDLYRNPIMVLPTIILLVATIVLSSLSASVNKNLHTTFLLTLWVVLFSLIVLAVMSFLFAGLISMGLNAARKKPIINFLAPGKNFWFRNFQILLIIVVTYNIINFAAYYISFFVGKTFNLPLSAAQVLFYFLYFAGLVGIIIFLTLSSFCLLIDGKSAIASIKISIRKVKSAYLEVLITLVLFFVVDGLMNKFITQRIIIELINSFFIIPYLSVILTRLSLSVK